MTCWYGAWDRRAWGRPTKGRGGFRSGRLHIRHATASVVVRPGMADAERRRETCPISRRRPSTSARGLSAGARINCSTDVDALDVTSSHHESHHHRGDPEIRERLQTPADARLQAPFGRLKMRTYAIRGGCMQYPTHRVTTVVHGYVYLYRGNRVFSVPDGSFKGR